MLRGVALALLAVACGWFASTTGQPDRATLSLAALVFMLAALGCWVAEHARR